MWWCGDSCSNTSSQTSFLFSVPAYPFPSCGAPYLWLGECNSLQTALKPRTFLGAGWGCPSKPEKPNTDLIYSITPQVVACRWLTSPIYGELAWCAEEVPEAETPSTPPKTLLWLQFLNNWCTAGQSKGGCDPFSQYCCLSPVLSNHNPRLNEDDLRHIVCSESSLHTAGLEARSGEGGTSSFEMCWVLTAVQCSQD